MFFVHERIDPGLVSFLYESRIRHGGEDDDFEVGVVPLEFGRFAQARRIFRHHIHQHQVDGVNPYRSVNRGGIAELVDNGKIVLGINRGSEGIQQDSLILHNGYPGQ